MCQPDVTDAVVVLHDGITDQEPCLVGYVVAPANVSPAALRKGLAERLPSYMVPSHIAVLDQFPIASSGKIDIAALPPPACDEARPAVLRTPSDDREHELLKIWQEVLKIPNIGIGNHATIVNAIIDKNARIGDNVMITNSRGLQNHDGENYYVRDKIVVIPKNAVIHNGTII